MLSTLWKVVRESLEPAARNALWLLTIIVPVSLVVRLLQYWQVLTLVAGPLSPVFRLVGLPGEAAVVYLTSVLLGIYSAIAAMATLALDNREITILAIMCLVAHAFPVEIPILASTGSRPLRMILLRLSASLVGAGLLHLLMPRTAVGPETTAEETFRYAGLPELLTDWAGDTALLAAKIMAIVLGLMILTRLLAEVGIIRWVSRSLRPFFGAMGLPEDASFLWMVANTLGLAYGAAVMREEVRGGRIAAVSADLLNHHLAVSHSLLEDTLLFAALGAGAFWITVPRVGIAVAATWVRRARRARARA